MKATDGAALWQHAVMRFLSEAAILAVRDVDAAVALYAKLGFETRIYEQRLSDGRAIYGYLRRDQVALHLGLVADLDPKRNTTSVYIYVDDPDALHREWSVVIGTSHLTPPEDMPWGMREMTYRDPDGNALRIGRILK
jgi:catechol 2,3-dioxygenase-like lactoylglutathione lyase family enzyme